MRQRLERRRRRQLSVAAHSSSSGKEQQKGDKITAAVATTGMHGTQACLVSKKTTANALLWGNLFWLLTVLSGIVAISAIAYVTRSTEDLGDVLSMRRLVYMSLFGSRNVIHECPLSTTLLHLAC